MNILELNPYNKIDAEYQNEKNSFINRQNELKTHIDFYNTTDIENLNAKIKKLEAEESKLYKDINSCSSAIRCEKNSIKTIESKTGSFLNPFNWFDKEQEKLRTNLGLAQKKLANFESSLRTKNSNLATLKSKRFSVNASIKRYNAIDLESTNNECENISEKLKLINDKIEKNKKEKDSLDILIQPVIRECIDPMLKNIEQAEADIKILEYYTAALNNSYNSYQKAMIHQECQARYGDGKPYKVLAAKQSIVNKANIAIDKAKKRINTYINNGLKLSGFDEIILDGNNMCYQSTSKKFIGTDLLLKCAIELSKSYKLTIVFDNTILKHMKICPEKISRIFGKHNIKVHIVNAGTSADSLITTLADSPNKFILSNDKFVDFKDRECIAKNRIIKHLILSDKQIIIEALDLNIKL